MRPGIQVQIVSQYCVGELETVVMAKPVPIFATDREDPEETRALAEILAKSQQIFSLGWPLKDRVASERLNDIKQK